MDYIHTNEYKQNQGTHSHHKEDRRQHLFHVDKVMYIGPGEVLASVALTAIQEGAFI